MGKKPADALGTVDLRTNRNHTPNIVAPSYNVRIGLQGDQTDVQQKVVSYPSNRYYLGVFAATSDTGVTANLKWNGNLCGSTNEQWSRTYTTGGSTLLKEHYPLLSCDFVTGAAQNAVKIKLGGNASAGSIIGDDFYFIHLPNYTFSYYVSTLDYDFLYNLGCSKGSIAQNGENGVIFLDFGYPLYQNGAYGAYAFGSLGFVSTSQIADAAIAFIDGYAGCAQAGEHIILALGTNNCGKGSNANVPPSTRCVPGGGNVSYNHGRAWAQMLKNVQTYIVGSDPNYDWSDRISAAGASDIEPKWNYAQDSRAWVDGYSSVTVAQGRRPFYDYGSCDSCAYTECLTCAITLQIVRTDGSTIDWSWDNEDVFYVAYGAGPANAFPEIYIERGWNADQWYRLSSWAYTNHGYRISFAGVLTQEQACNDTQNSCDDIKNSPGRGWGQLAHWVTSDSRTNSAIPFSSDIRWNMQ